ncbi:hypothetical protein LTR36_006794 [Oleoguttula mirabilis]|uniref:Uncharacterized protein n=1 Tax=Oleoguttula mirabilis TaxID=1507867 RepID=A0AAV9JBZ6_9PEZI|nr:hypothetical protein LTR36_006794 [Oleoguttula mirabilis]
MAGLWRWIKELFDDGPAVIRALPTRPSKNNRRPNIPTGSGVASGRVQKLRSPSASRSPKARRRSGIRFGPGPRDDPPSPKKPRAGNIWPGSCAEYTQLLTRVIKRHEQLRLLERQRADVERHWDILQQRIDVVKLRLVRVSKLTANDAVREEKYILTKAMNGYVAEQRGLSTLRVRLESELGTAGAARVSEEDDVFAFLTWVMTKCGGKNGCVSFTPALTERFRDTGEIRDYVRAEEDQLARLRLELRTLEAGLLGVDTSEPPGRDAAAAVRRLTRDIDERSRAMTARHQYRDTALQNLFTLVRQTLLQQALLEPQVGDATDTDAEHPSGPIVGVDDTPGPIPPLDPVMAQRYTMGRKAVEWRRKLHDEYRSTYYKKRWDFDLVNPGLTQTIFDNEWCRDGWKATEVLRKTEKSFKMDRDDALRAGAAPEGMFDWADRDLDEFGGRHPDDGAVSSMSPTFGKLVKVRVGIITPLIYSWMSAGGVDDGHASMDHETPPVLPARDRVEYDRLAAERDRAEEERDTLQPWDSASSREPEPGRRGRINDFRSQQRHPDVP